MHYRRSSPQPVFSPKLARENTRSATKIERMLAMFLLLCVASVGLVSSGGMMSPPGIPRAAFATSAMGDACGSSPSRSFPVLASIASEYFRNYVPSNAFDGQFHTFWITNQKGGWITADLGTDEIICSVQISWFGAKSYQYSFTVLVSNSSDAGFRSVYTGTSTGTPSIESYPVSPAEGRFVKIVVNGNDKNNWSIIREIKFQGNDPSVSSPPPVDTTPPTIIPPANIIANGTGILTPVVIGLPTVTDNIDPHPVVTNNAPIGGFPLGNTTVRWTAMDASGNAATANQTVTILPSSSVLPRTEPPLTISMIRDDVNQTELTGFFKNYSTSRDFVFTLHTARPSTGTGISVPGQQMTTAGGSVVSASSISYAKSNGQTWFLFDEEPMNWSDYSQSLAAVHDAGLKFASTPIFSDIQANYSLLAHSDLVVLQINPATVFNGVDSGLDYAQVVQKYTSLLKSENPNIIVIVQYVTGPGKSNSADQSPIISAYNSVKNYCDGVLVFYFADGSDPLQTLRQFYNGTGFSPIVG